MNLLKRLKNLWNWSEIEAYKQEKVARVKQHMSHPDNWDKDFVFIPKNQAIIIKLRPKDEIEEILKNDE